MEIVNLILSNPDLITYPKMFKECTKITHMNLPESIITDKIGEDEFYGCTSLIEIIIPKSVKSIGRSAFYDCRSLRKVLIPDSVKSIGKHAFSGCTSLKEIRIPQKVKLIDEYTFNGCYSLSLIIMPKKIQFEKDCFKNCDDMKKEYY